MSKKIKAKPSKAEKAAKEAGAAKAEWDKVAKVLSVTFDAAKTSTDKIEEAVAAAGYDTENKEASTEAYKKLEVLGFNVSAMYYEPGMGFCGIYDEFGDDYYEFGGMSSQDMKDLLPQELDAEFGISENQEQWEEENPETDEVTEWYEEGVDTTGLEPHKTKK